MLLTESAIDQFENSKYKPLKLPTNSPFWDRVHLEDKLFKIYLKFMSRSIPCPSSTPDGAPLPDLCFITAHSAK